MCKCIESRTNITKKWSNKIENIELKDYIIDLEIIEISVNHKLRKYIAHLLTM